MFVNCNTTIGKNDNESITNAVNAAKESGTNKVLIPKHNDRTNSDLWVIEDTVYLPNDIEIVIDNAHLVLADRVYCNMFSNEKILETKERTIDDEQYGITIRGIGNAVLDGGNYNGLHEKNSEKDGLPHISKNTTILFVNCRNITVENISVINQRWWGITNIFVRESAFRNIYIRADISRFADGVHYPYELPRVYDEIYVKNADGIDLRVGCNNILIENISGRTEDDSIALTAIGAFEKRLGYYVDGKDIDIHDVKIHNITVDPYVCNAVRLLCRGGNKVYNIDIDGVNHVDGGRKDYGKTRFLIRLNDARNRYLGSSGVGASKGDMRDITIRNVVSSAEYAVCCYAELENITVENVSCLNGCGIGSEEDGAVVENLTFSNIRCHSGAAIDTSKLEIK